MKAEGEIMRFGLRFICTVLLPALLALGAAVRLFAGGAAEASESSRGAYVAEQGQIIRPQDIDIASYIASVDYGYPDPEGELGVTLYSGHRQVSRGGQEEIIQIGVQGTRTPFEELPVLNLALVIDESGSMSEPDKIAWAKDAFELLLRRLRPQDVLSVVAFSEEAQLLLPATRLGSISDREGLIGRVRGLTAEGASILEAGLEAGYAQVLAGYRPDGVNRVLLISDGLAEQQRALEVVKAYRRRGISLSTIGVGMSCDLKTLNALSREGAGSARFISNRAKMEEIFSTDLDRTAVPIAYDLAIELELGRGTELLGTWGYEHSVSGTTVHYSLPALHHRDYETMLVQLRLPAPEAPGPATVARVRLSYTDPAGAPRSLGPCYLVVDYADSSVTPGGFSDPTVLKAGTMLHIAEGLEAIGLLYYAGQAEAQRLAALNRYIWQNNGVTPQALVSDTLRSEQQEASGAIRAGKQRCLDLAEAIKKEIGNAHLRLGEGCFAEELTIARRYIEVLGKELGLGQPVIAAMLADEELQREQAASGSRKQLEDLAEELALGLEGRQGGSIAFFGFTSGEGGGAVLQQAADRIVLARLAELADFRIIGEGAIEQALARLELSRSSLLDNTLAFRAGELLGADYLLVGRIVQMSSSVVVFGKLLDRRSGAVASVAQAILARED
jgi:hypothetical protein